MNVLRISGGLNSETGQGSGRWSLEAALVGLVVLCSMVVLLQCTPEGADLLWRCLGWAGAQ
jgi:hypothetical protein